VESPWMRQVRAARNDRSDTNSSVPEKCWIVTLRK
jgi:hypothetical protein